MTWYRVLLCLLVALMSGCRHQQSSATRDDELRYLRAVVDESLLEHTHLEVAVLENLKLLEESGNDFLGLRVFGGQKLKNRGVRSELSIDFPHPSDATVQYEWRLRLPEDFEADPENRWWLIGQWHDQPDVTQGETWDNFPAHSPPILLGYGRVDGVDQLSVSYGAPDSQPIGLIPLTRGEWHSLRCVIRWSTQDDGRLAVFVDGSDQPAIEAQGRNMHNAYRHYFKLGMYRDPKIQGDCWLHIDDVRISVVEPSPSP